MNITSKNVTKRELFNLLQNSEHVKAKENQEVTLVGVVIRDEVTTEGEVRKAGYAITTEGALFGSAASFLNAIRELGEIFEEEILGNGIKVSFGTKEVGLSRNTIWVATLP